MVLRHLPARYSGHRSADCQSSFGPSLSTTDRAILRGSFRFSRCIFAPVHFRIQDLPSMSMQTSDTSSAYGLQDDALTLDGQVYPREQISSIAFHPNAKVTEQRMGGWLLGTVAFIAISISFGTSIGIILSNGGPVVYAFIFALALAGGLYVGRVGLPNRTKQFTSYGIAMQMRDGSHLNSRLALTPDNAALLRDELARRWSMHAQWRSLPSHQA